MLYFGIDWSEKDYQVSIVNEQGRPVSQFALPVSPAGFSRIETERRKFDVPAHDCPVAIETSYNLIVDYLLDRGYPVYIVPPASTKSYRNRQRLSGAHTDASDATLLAGIMRTDRDSHRRWQPYSQSVLQLAAQLRLIETLRRSIQRYANQLRAALLRTFPTVLDVFKDVTSPIALEFIQAYPTAAEAASLSRDALDAFLKGHADTRTDLLAKRYAGLTAPTPTPHPDVAMAYREPVRILADLLLRQVRARNQALAELPRRFDQHPDAPIFRSLPGVGDLLAPALLAKFGDQRDRFPTPGSVQALAGTCPVTERSGTRHRVLFRKGCDKHFRRIAVHYALASLRESSWAIAYWREIRPHCRSDSHATRILANRWLAIIWKCWQDRTEYDEQRHLKARAQRHGLKVPAA